MESTLKEIQSNKNIFENLNTFSQIPEMRDVRKRIISHMISRENIENDIEEALFTLQASTIFNLYTINELFITDPSIISLTINEYQKRQKCSHDEIQWISQIMKENSPNFLLKMPKLSPNSLLYLIVKNCGLDNIYNKGPLFRDVPNFSTDFILKENDIFYRKFSTFHEAVKCIVQLLYTSIISQDEVPPEKFENLRQAFIKYFDEKHTKLTKQIEILFTFSESLDNWPEAEFNFDDMFFTSMSYDELMANELIANSYPSFLFWAIENKSFMKQLMQHYKNAEMKSTELPLWVVCLRILSSQNCIKFESDSNSRFFEIINNETTNRILNFLNDTTIPNGCKWLNILRSDLPNNLKKPWIQLFHNYLKGLTFDNYEIENQVLNDFKTTYISQSVNNLTALLLYKQEHEIIEMKIIKSATIADFLMIPSKFIENYNKLVLNSPETNQKFFDFNCNLADITKTENQSVSVKTDFTSLANKQFLTSPILFISPESEICCTIKKVSLQIGPLFPSLNSTDIKVSFISVIDEKVTVSNIKYKY